MRTPTAEAAKRLGLTVPELFDLAAPLISDVSEAWPEIDVGYIETLQQIHGLAPEQTEPPVRVAAAPKPHETEELSPVDEAKLGILDKLERQDRWGGNTVSLDTLRNHYCRGVADLEEALKELIDQDLIVVGEKGNKRRGPFSLNPAKKGDIEREVERIR